MLKFGTPTIALPLAIKKCTVQTGCTVYHAKSRLNTPVWAILFAKNTENGICKVWAVVMFLH